MALGTLLRWGHHEQRATRLSEVLTALGWSDEWAALLADSPGQPARVIRHDTKVLTVQTADQVLRVPMEKASAQAIVGDWISVDEGRLVSIAERSSLLSRPNIRGTGNQALAANIDIVFAVCGMDRPLPPGRVDRLATLAWDAGAAPVLVLSKIDLAEDLAQTRAEMESAHPTLSILEVSATSGEGIAEIRDATAGKTAVLIGESGAGKSSIVNAMLGTYAADTGEVREGDQKGRHTTTSRQIHIVPTGGCIVDSPGIRQIGIVGNPDAVDALFDDITDRAIDCRFTDCSHTSEPGCAILAAVASGEIEASRYDRWRDLVGEAEATAQRADERARKAERQAGSRQRRR